MLCPSPLPGYRHFLCFEKNTESLLVSKQEVMADGIEDGFGGSPLVSVSGA